MGADLLGIGYRMDNGVQLEFNLASYRYIGDYDLINHYNLLMAFSAYWVL